MWGEEGVGAATLTADGLTNLTQPQHATEMQIRGWYGEQVMLEGSSPQRPPDAVGNQYRLWDPGVQESDGRWSEPRGFYPLGETEDQRLLWGVAHSTGNASTDCLALVDPQPRFGELRRTCDLELPRLARLDISPTGRYLAVSTDRALRVLDLRTAFDRPMWIEGCPPTDNVTWISADTLVSGLVICRVEPDGAVTTDALPAQKGNVRAIPVIRYGA